MSSRYRELIERLDLSPHPEGGYYREIYRSPLEIPADQLPGDFNEPRCLGTAIYFLLPAGQRSAPHRVHSEEFWIFLEGDGLHLRAHPTLETGESDDDGGKPTIDAVLSMNGRRDAIIPPGWWQWASVESSGSHGYCLVACVVMPGFEFDDFELAPNHAGHDAPPAGN